LILLFAALLLAAPLALDPERPRWNDGDVFGKLFGQRAAGR
jgi:hypothetical protein